MQSVETEYDWHFLCEINCDLAKGYFIGRRVAAEQVSHWLQRWQARLVWS